MYTERRHESKMEMPGNPDSGQKLKKKMTHLPARLLRKIRNTSAPHLTPVAGLLRQLRSRSIAILMYHGVTDEQTAIPDWCQVRVEPFRQQMEFLSQEYHVLGLGEVLQRLSNGLPLPERTACLTFDDGFQNVYSNAWPVLARYQLPSTVFVVTGLLESRLPPWPGRILYALSNTRLSSICFDGMEWELSAGLRGQTIYGQLVNRIKILPAEERERKAEDLVTALGDGAAVDFRKSPRATLGWNEIQELASAGLMCFESHTHTHASLSNCTADEQRQELKVSRDILRERLRTEDLFCYPFGDYAPATMKIVAELGYRCGLTTMPGLNPSSPDVYALRRVGIGHGMTAAMFEMAMLGCFE
jgi:peptidoglycan/xylan/chitin deacetylase (PgdA/CDA1 family)